MKTAHILIATTVAAGGIGLWVANTENEKIKKLIGKGKVEPAKTIPIKTTSTSSSSSYNSANGISARSPKVDIMRLQNALISAGHLAPTQRTKSGAMVSSADGIWGSMTTTAVAKAGLSSPVTEAQLNSIKKGSGSNGGSFVAKESNSEIAEFIASELKSVWSIDYATIHTKLKPLKKTDIVEIDAIYRREHNEKGLKKMFQSTDKGGKVSVPTANSNAILELFNDAGLSGIGYGVVRTKHACIIQDQKGNVQVGKDVVLGKVIAKEKHPQDRVYIETINGGQVIASPFDLIDHE